LSAADDWGLVFRAGLAAGTYAFYATAVDGFGFIGQPVSTTVTFTGSPGATVVSVQRFNDVIREDGELPAVFQVRRTGANAGDLVVNLVGLAGGGLATPGVDYAALPATVTIPAGQDAVRVNAYQLPDAVAEAAEAIRLSVAAGAGYSVSATEGTVDITLRDAATADVVPAIAGGYWFDSYPPLFAMSFGNDVAPSLSLADVTLLNRMTNQVVPAGELGLAYDGASGAARR
jgi:hypothetical protein